VTGKGKRLVVNTSPWIALSVCGQIPLLEKLYTDVYIPYGVKEEIMAGGKQSIGVNELKASPWVKVGKISDVEKVKLLYELEKGEAEVIILAKEKGIKQVLLDERVARLQARVLGFDVIGTLGLLLKAKKKGLLSSIKPFITNILDNGIWVKDEIVKGILREAGEE
jgi:Predicted nucleic acid-binding protein, contains PIN domain